MSKDETSMLCSPFCNPDMINDLEKCRVEELLPDVWWIEGYAGQLSFFTEPPSGNIVIIRDGDMVLMMDSGHHPFYRKRILEVLQKLKEDGAKNLVLTMSHGHWDHGKNNDVIFEAGYETTRFILPEPEFHTLNIPVHMNGDMKKAHRYYDPGLALNLNEGLKMALEWNKSFPAYNDPQYQETWKKIEALPDAPEKYDREQTFEAWASMIANVLASDVSSYAIDKAQPLKLADREERTYAGQTFLGWPVGRFFLIHDASQSPGHISIYDPLHKMMITGDATTEINPPFIDCNYQNGIDLCEKCLHMAEAGEILLATDGHRTIQWWPRFMKVHNLPSFSPIQHIEHARGKDECVSFYQMWVDYFNGLKDEVLKAHSRTGTATIDEIVEELRKSDNKYVKFKLSMGLPAIPSNPHALVAKVLDENGGIRHEEGDRILFSPPK